MSRTALHYIETLQRHGTGTVGRRYAAEAIYAARYGAADDVNRDELRAIMSEIEEEVLDSAEVIALMMEQSRHKETIGRQLERARRAKGWTQADLGRAADVAQAKISEYERGKRTPSVETLTMLAEALDVQFTIG
jgi:HTH-type transcriptional regulator/antitoxin HipB